MCGLMADADSTILRYSREKNSANNRDFVDIGIYQFYLKKFVDVGPCPSMGRETSTVW